MEPRNDRNGEADAVLDAEGEIGERCGACPTPRGLGEPAPPGSETRARGQGSPGNSGGVDDEYETLVAGGGAAGPDFDRGADREAANGAAQAVAGRARAEVPDQGAVGWGPAAA